MYRGVGKRLASTYRRRPGRGKFSSFSLVDACHDPLWQVIRDQGILPLPPGLNDLLGKDDNIHAGPPLPCEGSSDILHCPPGSRLAPSANNSQFLHPPEGHDADLVVDPCLPGDLSPAHPPAVFRSARQTARWLESPKTLTTGRRTS